VQKPCFGRPLEPRVDDCRLTVSRAAVRQGRSTWGDFPQEGGNDLGVGSSGGVDRPRQRPGMKQERTATAGEHHFPGIE
jgi:hypothetical protein